MNIAYIIFDGITLLDFIGIYDPISRLQSQQHLENISWDICAFSPSAKDSFGLEIVATRIKPNLATYDMVIVPGGFGTRELQNDKEFLQWLSTAEPVPYKVSICTGSLLLGVAGFLKGKHATTHFNEYDNLGAYAGQVHSDRIVRDGKIITAGAVASSLDLGLYICEMLAGKEAKEMIRKSMDYHPKIEHVKLFL